MQRQGTGGGVGGGGTGGSGELAVRSGREEEVGGKGRGERGDAWVGECGGGGG